jgi:hypothetical protein
MTDPAAAEPPVAKRPRLDAPKVESGKLKPAAPKQTSLPAGTSSIMKFGFPKTIEKKDGSLIEVKGGSAPKQAAAQLPRMRRFLPESGRAGVSPCVPPQRSRPRVYADGG